MGEFFKGWRRKMGCVTLVMACVFMGLLMQSYVIADKISNDFGGHNKYLEILLVDGNFVCWNSNHDYSKFNGHISFLFPRGIAFEQVSPENAKRQYTWESTEWRHQGGFGIEWSNLDDDGGEHGVSASIAVWRVSLLWTILPLTLLSAYLLLIKPRTNRPRDKRRSIRLQGNQMRAVLVGAVVWSGCILCGALCGGYLSFYFGSGYQLPKWNGWSYFWFAAKEGAMMSAVLSLPVAVIAFAIAWLLIPRNPPEPDHA